MTSAIRYEARPTFRDLHGRFTRATDQLIAGHREWARDEGRRFVTIAQRHAPKRSGEFARGIRFQTRVGNNSVQMTASIPQPLGKWIVKGTPPHRIVGRPYLAFFWERIGKNVVVRSVNHPGTKPNPFIREAYNEWIPGATATFNRISSRWVTTVSA
jgi:hypothetical protein